jgi:hypothetical protein
MYYVIWTKNIWITFWAIFSQTHLVTLTPTRVYTNLLELREENKGYSVNKKNV